MSTTQSQTREIVVATVGPVLGPHLADYLPRRWTTRAYPTLYDADAPARLLIDVLHAGADACVRQGALPVLAGHLLVGHRRRTARRSFY
jgi:hypothetical protein